MKIQNRQKIGNLELVIGILLIIAIIVVITSIIINTTANKKITGDIIAEKQKEDWDCRDIPEGVVYSPPRGDFFNVRFVGHYCSRDSFTLIKVTCNGEVVVPCNRKTGEVCLDIKVNLGTVTMSATCGKFTCDNSHATHGRKEGGGWTQTLANGNPLEGELFEDSCGERRVSGVSGGPSIILYKNQAGCIEHHNYKGHWRANRVAIEPTVNDGGTCYYCSDSFLWLLQHSPPRPQCCTCFEGRLKRETE